MGLTPGHLSIAIKRQAVMTVSPLASSYDEQILLVMETMASQTSEEKEEKEEQRCFQAAVSRPEGLMVPSALRAVS